jgi:hypothetical protein
VKTLVVKLSKQKIGGNETYLWHRNVGLSVSNDGW